MVPLAPVPNSSSVLISLLGRRKPRGGKVPKNGVGNLNVHGKVNVRNSMEDLMKASLSLALFCLLVLAVSTPALACPPCSQPQQWAATPCWTTNCSPCGFCSYCCGRYGIGCENCEIFEATSDGKESWMPATEFPLASLVGSATEECEGELTESSALKQPAQPTGTDDHVSPESASVDTTQPLET